MSERKTVTVDEKKLQEMIAGDVHLYKPKSEPEIQEQEEMAEQEPEKEKEKVTKKKPSRQPDFAGTFLDARRIGIRQQVYISKDTFDLISRYLPIISDRKVSMTAYLENILLHHIETNKDAISTLYENKYGKLFKD